MRCPKADCKAVLTRIQLPEGQARWVHGRATKLDLELSQAEEAIAASIEEWLDAVHAHLAECVDCEWLNSPHALVGA